MYESPRPRDSWNPWSNGPPDSGPLPGAPLSSMVPLNYRPGGPRRKGIINRARGAFQALSRSGSIDDGPYGYNEQGNITCPSPNIPYQWITLPLIQQHPNAPDPFGADAYNIAYNIQRRHGAGLYPIPNFDVAPPADPAVAPWEGGSEGNSGYVLDVDISVGIGSERDADTRSTFGPYSGAFSQATTTVMQGPSSTVPMDTDSRYVPGQPSLTPSNNTTEYRSEGLGASSLSVVTSHTAATGAGSETLNFRASHFTGHQSSDHLGRQQFPLQGSSAPAGLGRRSQSHSYTPDPPLRQANSYVARPRVRDPIPEEPSYGDPMSTADISKTLSEIEGALQQRSREEADPVAAADVERIRSALEDIKGSSPRLFQQYQLLPESKIHVGRNSCIVLCRSCINNHTYALKFFASSHKLKSELELQKSGIGLIMPALRESRPHQRGVLGGGVMVSKAGCTLEDLLDDLKRSDQKPFKNTGTLMHFITCFAVILDTLHRTRYVHGNITAHHVVVDTSKPNYTYTLVDLSCSRKIEDSSYAPWGDFDVRYASPEVIAAKLRNEDTRSLPVVSATSDMWSFGILLFQVATGVSYWGTMDSKQIIECLMGMKQLPHSADPNYLWPCGDAAQVVARLLSRQPTNRMRVTEVVDMLTARYARPLNESSIPPQALPFIRMYHQSLIKEKAEARGVMNSEKTMRTQLTCIHHLMTGQELLLSLQIWEAVDAEGSSGSGGFVRRLCPLAVDLRQVASEPVFQLVQHRTYYISCLIQNRDPSINSMPFNDVPEIRLCGSPDARNAPFKPMRLESSKQLWWVEIAWDPSAMGDALFHDPSKTTLDAPGQLAVSLHLSVPYDMTPLKVKHVLKFNLNGPDEAVAGEHFSGTLDLKANAEAAKTTMIKNGISFITTLGGSAAGCIHSLVSGAGK